MRGQGPKDNKGNNQLPTSKAPAPATATAPAPAPAPTSGTQNIQSNYGQQANNSGTQYHPKYNFAPASKTSGTQQQWHRKHTAEVNNGTQNIQGDYGIQANNSGTQYQPTFTYLDQLKTNKSFKHRNQQAEAQANNYGNQFNNQGNGTGTGSQHPAPPTRNIQGDHGKQANNSGIQHQPEIAFSQTTQMPTTATATAQMPTTAPVPTSGTQNFQGNYGQQANNSCTQYHPKYNFAPAPKTSGTQQQCPKLPAEVNNGTQDIQGDYGIQANYGQQANNIQGNYGQQANNSGYQDNPTFDFSQGTQTPANNSGT